MLRKLITLYIISIICISITGCAEPSLYHWGEYESLTYDIFHNPGKADPLTQILKLREDIETAHAEGKMVPPGIHAHLGYMYYLQQNLSEAREAFETEKRLFPESETFINGIIKRMER